MSAKAWEKKAVELEACKDKLEAELRTVSFSLIPWLICLCEHFVWLLQKNEQFTSTLAELEDAVKRIKEHEMLEAEVLRKTAGLHRRFSAYVEDSKEVLSAFSEGLERKELEPVLLLGMVTKFITVSCL